MNRECADHLLNNYLIIQVLTIVDKSFSNPCIKEHLVLAISSMDTAEQPTSPHASKVTTFIHYRGGRKSFKVGGGITTFFVDSIHV